MLASKLKFHLCWSRSEISRSLDFISRLSSSWSTGPKRLRQTLVRLWRGKVLLATSLSSAMLDNWTLDISKISPTKLQNYKNRSPDSCDWSLMSEYQVLLMLWLCLKCVYVRVSSSLVSFVSLLHTVLFKCTFVEWCGVYNLPTTRQSEQPPRATLSLVALSPTLSKKVRTTPTLISHRPLVPCLAVRRAKRSVLIFLPECEFSDNTERTFPMSELRGFLGWGVLLGTCTSSWWLCVYYRTRLYFPPSCSRLLLCRAS